MSTTPYLNQVDICNRALQHLGASRITAITDDTKSADACEFCYDKLRLAELERNTWIFATKRAILRAVDSETMVISPPLYSATTYYNPGAIVSDSNGIVWVNRTPFNYGLAPGSDPSWDVYFGPLSVTEYDSTKSYNTGELVYVDGAFAGLTAIYVAMSNNSDNPATVPAYDATVTYNRGQVVSHSGNFISLIDLNTANTPASSLALWLVGTTYAQNAQVITPDGRIYTSVNNGNVGHQPSPLIGTYWTLASSNPYVQPWLTYTGGASALTWVYVGDGITQELANPGIYYPAGTGPSTQTSTSNVYIKPNGFLRKALSDPKQGSASFLGAPSNLMYSDWVMEGNYIVSQDIGPIMVRFVASVTKVTDMSSLFCEALAARMAFEMCEELTQSTDKQVAAAQVYKKAIADARATNAIALGAAEFAMDDYLACRI